MRETVFVSPIGKYLDEFISMKRSMGYKYEANIYQLKALDTACLDFGDGTVCLQKATVDRWTSRRPNESTRTYLRRIKLSNEVAEYLRLRGIDAYILPQSHVSASRSGQEVYIPHIFGQQELVIFFRAADCHPSHRAHPICNTMYSVLFRLLYCCGLRVSEALRLTYRDIDTTEKKLYIYNSKFCKDRIVPISESMCDLLMEYLQLVQTHYHNNIYVFPSRFSDSSVSERSVYGYFRKVLWEAGIPHGGRGKGPRVHDFRHSFAVHSLHKMIGGGMDAYAALPILAAYLGHEDIGITERYLRLTADVFPEILKQVDSYCGSVIPEVKYYENN